MNRNNIIQVAEWLKAADALVINTGAGMGVDSGLKDYRGEGGVWAAMETKDGQSVFDVVNPKALAEHPEFAWKLHFDRLTMFEQAVPHKGFHLLQKWIRDLGLQYFVLTSNVDNQFQKAGFPSDKIREVHGSMFHWQCAVPCSKVHWPLPMSLEEMKREAAEGKYPKCPNCGGESRPNVYMFRDSTYVATRSDEQQEKYEAFLKNAVGKRMVVLEIGSGPHVQSIPKLPKKPNRNKSA